ncbi:HlyD family secretion protein [Achromobacter aegrifaciens]
MSTETTPAHAPSVRQVILHTSHRILAASAIVLALGGLVYGAYALWHGTTPYERTENAYVKGDLTYVATKVSGYVQSVDTENNRKVEAGQQLVRIDPKDYQAAVADAESAVALASATLEQIGAQQTLQATQIRIAQATVTSARAQAARNLADYRRAQSLVQQGGVSRALYDQASAEQVRAASTLTQNEAQAEYAQQQLTVLQAQREAAQASRDSARARLDKARNDLAATTVVAPREGRVAGRNVRPGEYVAVGTRLMAVAPTRDLWVEANLKETQLGRIRPGDRVSVRVDAIPDARYCATVESVAGASGSEFAVIPPDNATGNFTKIVRRFTVRIVLDPDQPGLERLGTGMSAVPTIAIDSRPGAQASWNPLRLFYPGFTCAAKEQA